MLIEYVIGSNIVNRMPQVLKICLRNKYHLSACTSYKSGTDSFVQFTNIKILRREKMGTLFNQPTRKDYFDNDAVKFLDTVKTLARDHGLTVEETCRVLELSMKIDDYDRKDEHIVALERLIKDLINEISMLREKL
ncbi:MULTISPECIES: hypothetical protein [Priestia]|jgi:hypothetical protein|uniref:hypothetical protein n=2 Tax=Priestia TaxID=2800373 RepID=UPI000A93BF22|nr:hypothetical protein [Priestia megaterium]MCF8886930.1 hypothetical protein [Priestia megaterium]MEB2264433.1 hypothetical protein [Priestia megaterium]